VFFLNTVYFSYVTSRDQYQALQLATVVHVMKSTPLRHRLRSYTISRCAKNSKIIGYWLYGRWPTICHAR